jgi:hypothetical protein
MTFEDVAQQYFDPLTQTQRVVIRYHCNILLRGTYTMFPGIRDDRSDLNANASHKLLLNYGEKPATSPPLFISPRKILQQIPSGKSGGPLKNLFSVPQWIGILSQVGEDVHGGGLN